VYEAFFGETETMEILTEARHYCVSRRSRDRSLKTEATSMLATRPMVSTG